MIKFFRRIRYNLMETGKKVKYLKYAIGEIVLVVIGILIALSINNWNESRKSIQKGHEILVDVKENELVEIDLNLNENHKIKTLAFEFLYLNDECSINLKAFTDAANQYYFIGKTKKVKVSAT